MRIPKKLFRVTIIVYAIIFVSCILACLIISYPENYTAKIADIVKNDSSSADIKLFIDGSENVGGKEQQIIIRIDGHKFYGTILEKINKNKILVRISNNDSIRSISRTSICEIVLDKNILSILLKRIR